MQLMTEANLAWSTARFPNRVCREDFLTHVRLWNRIEDLPRIEVQTFPDGRSVRYLCRDHRGRGLGLLIESYGGQSGNGPAVPAEYEDWS